MEYTKNYRLKKPLDNETAEIQDIRDNMDAIDAALGLMLTKAELPVSEPEGSIAEHNTSSNPHANMGWASKKELSRAMPIGAILMWSGAVAAIPDGWALCDGTNGTPDLRDRFIVGAGGAYAVGDRGGAASVALTVDQMPSHCHEISNGGSGSAAPTPYSWTGSGNMPTTYKGGNQSHENRPPYYALCFIMFKGA